MNMNEDEEYDEFSAKLVAGVWQPGKCPEVFDEETLGKCVGAKITWATFITGLGRAFAKAPSFVLMIYFQFNINFN